MEEDNPELTGIAKYNAERKAAKEAAEQEKQAAAESGNATPPASDPPAGDQSGSDPSPEFRGKTSDDLGGKTSPGETTADPSDENDPFVKLAKEYAKQYPENKIFYITSDLQVFLAKSKDMARLHQRGREGQVTTVKLD